jgi:3-oxoacyl-[acyl-carrier protein] reductase
MFRTSSGVMQRSDEGERPVILVTGSGRGIGRHLAEHFAALGTHVVGCSRSSVDWSLDGYTHVVADVTREDHVKALLGNIRRRFSRLDVVVNNAGVAAMNAALLTPVATIDRIMAVNFRGTVLVCREAAKIMVRRRYGRIVNLGTVAVPMRIEGEALYAASKSAVVAFSQILARELGPVGITVNVVGPSPIDTDLLRGVPAERIDRIVEGQAIKRRGRFEDVTNVVEFFARPESGFITGQVLYLGGA